MSKKKRRKAKGMEVAGVSIPQPKSLDEAVALDKHLARLERDVTREAVSLLFAYLDRDKYLNYGGKVIKAKEKLATSKDSFTIVLENDDEIKVNAKTINSIGIEELSLFHAKGYDTLREIRGDILDARAKVKQVHDVSPTLGESASRAGWRGILYWGQFYWNKLWMDEPDLKLEPAIRKAVEAGFGGRARAYSSLYRKQARKDVTAFAAGCTLTAIVAALLFAQPDKPGIPMDDPVSRSGGAGGEGWDPNGNGGGKKSKSKPKTGKKSKLQDLQDRHLGKGTGSPLGEPTRMDDVRAAYLRLTEELPVEPRQARHDLSKPEAHYPPRDLPPYPLSNEGLAAENPEIDNGNRSLLLVLDVTGSMHNPEWIRGGNPAPGYFLATQLLRSYSDIGAPLRIMKYPLTRVTEEAIVQTNSLDAALEALLYANAGADDSDAVEEVATLYLTAFAKNKPMDVVFITDRGPTLGGCEGFMQLEKETRGKDTIYWVNTSPDGFTKARVEPRVDALNSNSGKRYHYHSAGTVEQAKEVAKKIVEGYK
jgi:hypothetical protein